MAHAPELNFRGHGMDQLLVSFLSVCSAHIFLSNHVLNHVFAMNLFYLLINILSLSVSISASSQNLTCYQCIKDSNEECGPEHLLPCPKVADRCVTHISRRGDKGYQIKRECGLGPCQFEDDMASKGLGMNDCDRNKEEFFCVFCCKTDGCNKNTSTTNYSGAYFTISVALWLTLTRFCYI